MAIKGIQSSSTISYDKATFNIMPSADLEVGVDVAPHYIIRNAGPLISSLATEFSIKVAPRATLANATPIPKV